MLQKSQEKVQTAIQALVAANGNVPLTAERLNIPEDVLISILASDPIAADILAQQFRTRALIKTYQNYDIVSDSIAQELPNMQGSDLIKAYAAISQMLSRLVDNTKPSRDAIIALLPPEIRDAISALLLQQENQEE